MGSFLCILLLLASILDIPLDIIYAHANYVLYTKGGKNTPSPIFFLKTKVPKIRTQIPLCLKRSNYQSYLGRMVRSLMMHVACGFHAHPHKQFHHLQKHAKHGSQSFRNLLEMSLVRKPSLNTEVWPALTSNRCVSVYTFMPPRASGLTYNLTHKAQNRSPSCIVIRLPPNRGAATHRFLGTPHSVFYCLSQLC